MSCVFKSYIWIATVTDARSYLNTGGLQQPVQLCDLLVPSLTSPLVSILPLLTLLLVTLGLLLGAHKDVTHLPVFTTA